MINLYKQDGEILYGIKEFLLDSEDDVKDLPTKKIHVGSMAMVIPTGSIYVLNGLSEWVEMGNSNETESTKYSCEEVLNVIDADGNNIVDANKLNSF